MTDEWLPIDGETPIDDLSDLVDRRSIRSRAELNRAEAENIRIAVVKLLASVPNARTAPFTVDWMLKVHKLMFCDVWTFAGHVRNRDLTIGTRWELIGQELGGLSLEILSWTDTWPRLEQAVTLHHRAVRIHPFQNGNGRWSRLLANIWLRRHGEPIVEWPEPDMGKESSVRGEYVAAIRAADAGDIRPLTELHRRFWQEEP